MAPVIGDEVSSLEDYLLGAGVVVLRWPPEADRFARAAGPGQPVLLLIEEGSEPPAIDDCCQDWVRLPADRAEIALRVRSLCARARAHQVIPTLDDHRRLLSEGRWVALSPVEERLARPLVEQFGQVVGYEELQRRGWPGAPTSENALRLHLMRLRRKVADLGLDLRSVRAAGAVLQRSTAGDDKTSPTGF